MAESAPDSPPVQLAAEFLPVGASLDDYEIDVEADAREFAEESARVTAEVLSGPRPPAYVSLPAWSNPSEVFALFPVPAMLPEHADTRAFRESLPPFPTWVDFNAPKTLKIIKLCVRCTHRYDMTVLAVPLRWMLTENRTFLNGGDDDTHTYCGAGCVRVVVQLYCPTCPGPIRIAQVDRVIRLGRPHRQPFMPMDPTCPPVCHKCNK